jgi:teichuronic acid biosynthesis glycosyltransferase TuaC
VGGEIPAAEMVLWMNASDALILTSRGEGSPNVVKEAMFCNLPIVTVDVGDVREIIGAARHCHICPPDPGSLAHGLTSVLRALPERSDGRERSDWIEGAIVAGRLIELYQEARRRGPGVLGFLGSGTFAND